MKVTIHLKLYRKQKDPIQSGLFYILFLKTHLQNRIKMILILQFLISKIRYDTSFSLFNLKCITLHIIDLTIQIQDTIVIYCN